MMNVARLPLLIMVAAVATGACGNEQRDGGNDDGSAAEARAGSGGSAEQDGSAGETTAGGSAGLDAAGAMGPSLDADVTGSDAADGSAGGNASGDAGIPEASRDEDGAAKATPDVGAPDVGASDAGADGSKVKDAAPTFPVSDAGPACDLKWPVPTETENVPHTIKVMKGDGYDGMMKRFVGAGDLGPGGQNEGQDPLFDLEDGTVLRNVIIGAAAADGVHCNGNCRLENVWWEDVGASAVTQKGDYSNQAMLSNQHMFINGGGAMHASGTVFQDNGPGRTHISNFYVKDFGELYRSCGNCASQFRRYVDLNNITAAAPGGSLVALNTNYGDIASLAQITLCDPAHKLELCLGYEGNNIGEQPAKSGPNEVLDCFHSDSDITWK